MKKHIFILLSCWLLAFASSAQTAPVSQQVVAKLEQYHKVLPVEKLYLHLDRSLYKPGEVIWYKAYLTGADQRLETAQSNILLVELIDPKGNIIQECKVLRRDEFIRGDFLLSNDAVGGVYKIRAYSEWMQNFEEDLYFEKAITVQKLIYPKILLQLEVEKESYGAGEEVLASLEVRALDNTILKDHPFEYQIQLDGRTVFEGNAQTNNLGKATIAYRLPDQLNSVNGLLNVIVEHEGKTESIARSIPIQFDNIQLDFMPEGGDLVANLPSRVAFKALNSFGKPADISAQLMDSQGNILTTFSSFHDGMGAFEFTPKATENYYVKIISPNKNERQYNLPMVQKEGIVIRLVEHDSSYVLFDLLSSKDQRVYTVVQMQHKIYKQIAIPIKAGNAKWQLPISDLPMGIAQVTLFDEAMRPQAERLFFVNRHRQLQVEVTTNKDTYQPQDKVKLSIKVRDSAGKGVKGNFSLAVIDDKLHTYADDKQDNILSYFLMSTDLRGDIHEPSFYFDREEEKAAQALDYVLMTHAWRRFTWKDVLEGTKEIWENVITVQSQRFSIGGYVSNVPVRRKDSIAVRIKGTDLVTYTKENPGRFEFKDISIKEFPIILVAECRRYKAETEINPEYHLVIDPDNLTTNQRRKSKPQMRFDVQKEAFSMEEVEKKEGLPTININELARISAAMQAADQGNSINVRGSRSNSTDYYIDGLRVSGESLIPASELSEVVVVGYGVSNSSMLNDYVASSTTSSNSYQPGNQDYDFNISGPVYQSDMKIYVDYDWNPDFHYPRQFYSPITSSNTTDDRKDFRKTIYWNPMIKTDANGEAKVSFYTSDEISTFRTIVEGITDGGQIARGEGTYNTELPFSIDAKLPLLLVQGDEIELPIVLKNNTNRSIEGSIQLDLPNGFELISGLDETSLHIGNNNFKKLPIRVKINAGIGAYPIKLAFQSGNLSDVIQQVTEVVPSTFPRAAYLSAKDLNRSYEFEIDNLIEGSLKAEFKAIPNALQELTAGVDGILREPNGCFEQVSSSNYPNILALQLMESSQVVDPTIRQKAQKMLQIGYKKLTNYEVLGGGFSLYGKQPANLGLTAYGLVQFKELQEVHPIVDQKMIERTVDWLLAQRNEEEVFDKGGKGGYQAYGRVSDAYVVYALSMVKAPGIEAALLHENNKVREDQDLYRLALMALANRNYGNFTIANELTDLLEKSVVKQKVSNWETAATITRSYGHSKKVELAAWVALALLEADQPNVILLDQIIQFLHSKKRGAGYFGSTQATALALKTINVYTQKVITPTESGDIEIHINDKLIASTSYDENTQGVIAFDDLSQHFQEGKNNVQVRFLNTIEPLAYTLDATWQAHMPELQSCDVSVRTELEQESAKVGESVRLNATVQNLTANAVPTPMAIIGIPSSMSLDVKQLKRLQEECIFDFFEIQDNYLVIHYESLAAQEERQIPIDLKVEFSGKFRAPASSAFLYYESEKKHWVAGAEMVVQE